VLRINGEGLLPCGEGGLDLAAVELRPAEGVQDLHVLRKLLLQDAEFLDGLRPALLLHERVDELEARVGVLRVQLQHPAEAICGGRRRRGRGGRRVRHRLRYGWRGRGARSRGGRGRGADLRTRLRRRRGGAGRGRWRRTCGARGEAARGDLDLVAVVAV